MVQTMRGQIDVCPKDSIYSVLSNSAFCISAAALLVLTRHRAYLPSLGAEKAASWRQQTTGQQLLDRGDDHPFITRHPSLFILYLR